MADALTARTACQGSRTSQLLAAVPCKPNSDSHNNAWTTGHLVCLADAPGNPAAMLTGADHQMRMNLTQGRSSSLILRLRRAARAGASSSAGSTGSSSVDNWHRMPAVLHMPRVTRTCSSIAGRGVPEHCYISMELNSVRSAEEASTISSARSTASAKNLNGDGIRHTVQHCNIVLRHATCHPQMSATWVWQAHCQP